MFTEPEVYIVGEKSNLKWFCHTNTHTHTLMNTHTVLTAITIPHALCGQSTEAYTSTVEVDTYMYLYIYAWTCTCNRLLISMSANWVGVLSLLLYTLHIMIISAKYHLNWTLKQFLLLFTFHCTRISSVRMTSRLLKRYSRCYWRSSTLDWPTHCSTSLTRSTPSSTREKSLLHSVQDLV